MNDRPPGSPGSNPSPPPAPTAHAGPRRPPRPSWNWPFEAVVGWRLVRGSGRAGGNPFVATIALVSAVGVALGVAALIVVMSVVNGFRTEVQARMLDVVSHVELMGPEQPAGARPAGAALAPDAGAAATAAAAADGADHAATAAAIAAAVSADPRVQATAPFVLRPVLLGRGDALRGVALRGVDPAREPAVTPLAADALRRLVPGQRQVLVGRELARQLGLAEGDSAAVVQAVPPQGMRTTTVTVAGVFDAGHHAYDSGLLLMHLTDAQALLGLAGANGLRLRLLDPSGSRAVADDWLQQLPLNWQVADWTRHNAAWFAALAHQRRMLFLILALIVAVAAFNLVSTLVMSVVDRRANVAILRTLGARPASIMAVFMIQGAWLGGLGTLAGVALGLGVAFQLPTVVPALEQAFNIRLLAPEWYLIDHLPSQPRAADVLPVAALALGLSLVATLYPSWRASRLNPVEALRDD